MKYLILIFSVVVGAIAITEEQKTEIRETAKECIKSSGVSKEVLSKLKNGEVVDEPPLRSFVSCVFQKLKFAKADGTVDVDRIKDRFPSGLTDDERTSIINDCLGLKGTDASDTTFNIYKCYKQKTNKSHLNLVI